VTANWGVHLFHATWQSAVVALIAIAISRSFPRASSRLRYALLGIAMIKFALPPMLPLPVGAFSAMPSVGSSFFWPAERPFVFGSHRVLQTLMCIHAGGAVIALLILMRRALQMRRLIRHAARTADGMVISAEAKVPFAYGLFRPKVVLPEREWRGDELRDVVAHETMHVALHDSRHAAAQALLAVVWWWNPVYWLLSAELRRVREERCDDAVLAAGLSTAWRYSRSIIDVAAAAGPVPLVAMASHPLEPRLRRLADEGIRRSARLNGLQIAILLLAALILLPGIGRGASAPRNHIHIHIH
jgi:beta-lactamase regulating signal transducer with metallopeptidase domain